MSIPKIGEGRDRVDGRPKVTGAARYAAEHNLDGIVHAVVVHSTIASGRIKSLDATAAKKAPGVLAVISYLNAQKIGLTPPPAPGNQERQPQPNQGNYAEPKLIPLGGPEIQYLGQQIAVVVAERLEQATHAATLVKIAYDQTPPRTDMRKLRSEATEKGAAQAPPVNKGDAETALATAAVKIDQTYSTPYHHHNPMEAHSIVVAFDGEQLTLYDSSQNIFASRATMARTFGIPLQNVHVLSPYVGGAFGSKGSTWPHVVIGAMAAREVKRPVKLWLPRKQLFFTNGHRPETEQRVALGASADGKLVALIHEGISQGNRVSDYNERFTRPTRMIYASPNIRCSNKVVDLNVPSGTYMRAPGENPGMFAVESAMDELAYALKMDPIALRLVNHADDDPLEHKPWSSKSLEQCYEQGAARFGWSRRNPEPRSMRDGRLLIGWGMASATYPAHRSPASVRAVMNADGTVVVSTGTHEMGMGTATVMQQLAAETLDLPFERVRFEYGDTALPQAPISAGSMTVASVGSAVHQAANELKRKLVELNGGQELASGDSWAALLHRQYLPAVEARVDAKPDPEEAKYASHAFGAQFAEVSVDPDLGLVRMRRMVSAFAAGRVLNAKTARSQYLGGIIQGIGMALLEQTHLDRRIGSFTNINFGEYLVPVNADIPPIDVILVEEDDPHVNPIGAKGIGEIGIVGVAPAIANAVYHATGKRVRDLPVTIEKVLSSL
ncbi:MAG TPA: xanthine dehydrogenase family protein molybdopterin-binding subunit [Thermoanaerobaculia bacterium]|jgi:xanthine dehydrogenase YagR molybdenum-binding subunit|nr:xanthine dehydrogenase family protein molybdopterin-binding subunit [Thermoanaerobaculia bacterium]